MRHIVICGLPGSTIHLLLLPLTLQPTVGFGLSNNVLPFFPICHQLSPSSHSQHLKISFYFLFPYFPGPYLLTPWCRVLPEQPTGLQLVKKFPAFHGTRRFITALTNVPTIHIFPYYIINSTIFGGKKITVHKVRVFYTTFVWNISLSKKKWATYYHKCTQVFMWSTHYSWQILIELGFFSTDFRKEKKFNENLSSGNRIVPRERAHMTKLTVSLRNFAKVSNILLP